MIQPMKQGFWHRGHLAEANIEMVTNSFKRNHMTSTASPSNHTPSEWVHRWRAWNPWSCSTISPSERWSEGEIWFVCAKMGRPKIWWLISWWVSYHFPHWYSHFHSFSVLHRILKGEDDLWRRAGAELLALFEDEFRAGRDHCAGDYGWNLRFETGRPHLDLNMCTLMYCTQFMVVSPHWIGRGSPFFQTDLCLLRIVLVEPFAILCSHCFQLRMMEKSATSSRRWRSPRPGRQAQIQRGIPTAAAVVSPGRSGGRETGTNPSKFVGTSANLSQLLFDGNCWLFDFTPKLPRPEFKRDGQSAAEQKATEQANEQQEKAWPGSMQTDIKSICARMEYR